MAPLRRSRCSPRRGSPELTVAAFSVVSLVSGGQAANARREAAAKYEADRYLRAGVAAYRQGRAEFQAEPLLRAKRLLARAVELRPSPEGFFFLGGTLSLMSKPRSATRAYLACLRLDPTSVAAHQELAPRSAHARRALAISQLWSGDAAAGARECDEAVRLAPSEPIVPYDCAQMMVLMLPPGEELPAELPGRAGEAPGSDGSSAHWAERIEPLFQRAQRAALGAWRGGPRPLPPARDAPSGEDPLSAVPTVRWMPAAPASAPLCPEGARAVRDWREWRGSATGADAAVADSVELLAPGGEVYGQRVPQTYGGPFTWAGQRYLERAVVAAVLRDVLVSGNEGVITRGCDVFVPYYDVQIPWHENLPWPDPPTEPVRRVRAALWLLVMFPANFFSFLIDELARLAVWLVTKKERLPLLVPADRGRLKSFMYDWFDLLGGFEVLPYDVRPHFTGAAQVAAPRLLVQELHVVDWRDPEGAERRGDVFLLPPRWALLRLRGLAVGWALGAGARGTGHASAGGPTLLWIQRSAATTRRVANEPELLDALGAALEGLEGPRWTVRVFSDTPSVPPAREAVRLFHEADIVVGVHGSGQANMVFCQEGAGVIDINIPEPHSHGGGGSRLPPTTASRWG
ncbi:unnamed protein product [Prorocentrum cordatum]|uniref:Glycosyltransferase 61 catalytic domain-containing protein n=1 Tax=Prorocentrum cordatum TaxID=2364126 RepID=A0ABN9WAK2_9DINO|nr:unnamed protein product [Polarella glacialis]